jgi:hypothetical protein
MNKVIYISFILVAMLGFIACEDPLTTDEYSRRLIVGDSIPEVNKTTRTYNYVSVVNETDTIYIEIPVDTISVNRNENAKLLRSSLYIFENYKYRTPLGAEIEKQWNTNQIEIHEEVTFEYYNENKLPKLNLDLDIYNDFDVSQQLINIESIEIDLHDAIFSKNIEFFDIYRGLEVNIAVLYNGKRNIVENYRNEFNLIIHNVETHPTNENIPLFIEFSMISDNLLNTLEINNSDFSSYNLMIHGFLICY